MDARRRRRVSCPPAAKPATSVPPRCGGCCEFREGAAMNPRVCHVVATLVLAAAAAFVGIGCDDPAGDIPQAVLDQQARQAEAQKSLPKIPTTQDLVNGPRTVMPLGPLPMTMRVPASWRVEVAGGASLLRGFTPNGEVAIQLTSRPSLKKANF